MSYRMNSKIRESHLARKAIVYLRQSSPGQVKRNTESQRLQYDLAEEARRLGWRGVDVIDSDLGSSASLGASVRKGYEHIIWQEPTVSFISDVLQNPFYAGAYVYGRRVREVTMVGGRLVKRQGPVLRPEEARVFLRDHHDDRGLWTYRGVHFSRFGSLLQTAEAFVNRADCGFFAHELAAELQVEAKAPLLQLVRQQRLARKEVSGLYLYCSVDCPRRHEQLVTRQLPVVGGEAFSPRRDRTKDSDNAQAASVFFMTLLNERQRRLFAALESLRLGWGGDQTVARAIGMDPHTIAKGRRQRPRPASALERRS